MLADPAPFQLTYLHLLQAHFDLPIITKLLKNEDPKIASGEPNLITVARSRLFD